MPFPTLTTYVDGDELFAAQLNSDNSSTSTFLNTYGVFKNETATISAVWTFSVAPIISGALTLNAKLTISTGGADITGNITHVGNLSTTGEGGFTGNVGVGGALLVTGSGIGASGTLAVGGTSAFTGAVTMAATLGVTGQVMAGSFVGDGSGLTNLQAGDFAAGGTFPAINGSALTSLSAANVTGTGLLPLAVLPTALGTKTFADVNTTVLTAGVTALGATTATSLALAQPLDFTLSGGADSLDLLNVASDQTISLVAGTGATRYLRVNIGGVVYKIPMQVS